VGWLDERRVWITGASSGIGRELAFAVTAAGARVVLSGRNLERLQEVCDGCIEVARRAGKEDYDRPEVLPFDIADQEARREALISVGHKPLNAIINNAGVSQRSLAVDTLPEVYRRILETNLMSAIELSLGAVPLIKRSGEGRIAAVSSIAGELTGPLRTGYGASKAGMNAFFYALRTELWKEKIPVTVVIPGYVRTDVSRNALTGEGESYGKMDEIQAGGMDPQRAAAKIVAAVERGRRTCRVGMNPPLYFGLFLKGAAPTLLDRLLRKAKVT
jgi:short-subunit dehydrogenase